MEPSKPAQERGYDQDATARTTGGLVARPSVWWQKPVIIGAVLVVAGVIVGGGGYLAGAHGKWQYASEMATLAQQQKSLASQLKTVAAEQGQIQSSSISGSGVYVVGHDIKSGIWHTNGDGGMTDGRRVRRVLVPDQRTVHLVLCRLTKADNSKKRLVRIHLGKSQVLASPGSVPNPKPGQRALENVVARR
jgi:hypothetical protein